MAFTVNDFRDLLEILRTMPEWKEALRRELLGEELLALPGLVRELIRTVEAMDKRLYRVEQDVEVLKTDVAGLKNDVAALKGDALERKYRERPFVYFRRILRKPKVLTDSELDDLLSQAQAEGALSEAEVEEISRLDAVVRGRRVSDGSMIYLAVEISAKIDNRDVARAVQRAKLLEKIPSVIAIPVVAGEQLTPEGAEALKQTVAWAVTDGYATEYPAA
jgi:type I site-specific restriction endonuclease